MKLPLTLAALLIASNAYAFQIGPEIDGDNAPDDPCGTCEPDQEPEPTPEPAQNEPSQAEEGDFIRPDAAGAWITGPIDWSCRNEPICDGQTR